MELVFATSDESVCVWIEQSTIHLKTKEPNGDPVELTEREAIELAKTLLKWAKELDS